MLKSLNIVKAQMGCVNRVKIDIDVMSTEKVRDTMNHRPELNTWTQRCLGLFYKDSGRLVQFKESVCVFPQQPVLPPLSS